MELTFATKSLRQLCESETTTKRELGADVAERLKRRLADLRAAAHANDLVAGRPRELEGAYNRCIAVHLYDGYRIVFCANHRTVPVLDSGGVDWSGVRRVKILGIERHMTNNHFQPDWVSAPGETIADILEERNLSSFEFARRIGHTPEDADALLRGQARITRETARQLEVVLGGSTAFWITRESQYREDLARLERVVRREEGAGWLSELPLKDMIRFGWVESIPGTDAVSSCLSFFGVPDVAAWRETYRDVLQMAAFRKSPSFASQPGRLPLGCGRVKLRAHQLSASLGMPRDSRPHYRTFDPLRAKEIRNSSSPNSENFVRSAGLQL